MIDALSNPPLQRSEWLEFNDAAKTARVTRLPMADEVPFPIEVQQVVKYYTQRM